MKLILLTELKMYTLNLGCLVEIWMNYSLGKNEFRLINIDGVINLQTSCFSSQQLRAKAFLCHI